MTGTESDFLEDRMPKEFKEFAIRGNVMDLAVAVVIGGAFGNIVTSPVEGLNISLVGPLRAGSTSQLK
jgi:large conductance mechanosensitive channel